MLHSFLDKNIKNLPLPNYFAGIAAGLCGKYHSLAWPGQARAQAKAFRWALDLLSKWMARWAMAVPSLQWWAGSTTANYIPR
jgi:hypothetical protein